MQNDVRRKLGEGLASDDHYAQLVLNPASDIQTYPTRFLRRAQVFRVQLDLPQRPVVFYAGLAPAGEAYVLTAALDNFVRLCKSDGLTIDTSEVVVEFATTLLEVTRSMAERFYLIRSVDDIEFRPELGESEQRARDAFVQQHASDISAPTAISVSDGYTVSTYAVREQAVENLCLRVSRNSDTSITRSVIQDDLPLVYGL